MIMHLRDKTPLLPVVAEELGARLRSPMRVKAPTSRYVPAPQAI